MEKLTSWFGQQKPSSPDTRVSADPGLLYATNSPPEELQRRLELRDIFRNEQLFQQYLPRSSPVSERWQQPGVRTWVDHWSPDTQFHPMDTSRVLFSSALSGFLVSTISTPFDVVKNYWIYSPHLRGVRSAATTREVISSVYLHGGFRSFYTGFAATCCTIIPANLIFFGLYERFRFENPPAIAGIKARTCAVAITMPAEYVRTRLQANAGEITFREIARRISLMEGVRTYLKGITITMLRDAPFSAVYWTLNERFKAQLVEYDKSFKKDSSAFRSKFVYPFISGATAAAVATTLTQPFDVVKTNIQGMDNLFKRRGAYYKPYDGIMSVAGQIYNSQGWKGFLVGLVPRLAKIIPSCAVLLATYDFSKALLTSDAPDLDYEAY